MTKVKSPHAEMLSTAGVLGAILAPYCERWAIAGSLRRGAAAVSDIEFVLIADDQLYDDLGEWAATEPDKLRPRQNINGKRIAWGRKMMCLEFWDSVFQRWVAVDLFFTTPEQWAVTLVVRTGDADFSTLLVTRRSRGGFCPDALLVRGWRIIDNGDPIETDSEVAVFRALNLPYIAPPDRTAARGAELTRYNYRMLMKAYGDHFAGLTQDRYIYKDKQLLQHNQPAAAIPDWLYASGQWFHDGKKLDIPQRIADAVRAAPVYGLVGQKPHWVCLASPHEGVYLPAGQPLLPDQVIHYAMRAR